VPGGRDRPHVNRGPGLERHWRTADMGERLTRFVRELGHAKDTIAKWAALGAKCFAELRGLIPST